MTGMDFIVLLVSWTIGLSIGYNLFGHWCKDWQRRIFVAMMGFSALAVLFILMANNFYK